MFPILTIDKGTAVIHGIDYGIH